MFAALKDKLARRWLKTELKGLGEKLDELVKLQDATSRELQTARTELFDANIEIGELVAKLDAAQSSIRLMRDGMEESRATRERRFRRYEDRLVIAVDRLEMIAEKETSGANATVRSMAKIARAAIAELQGGAV